MSEYEKISGKLSEYKASSKPDWWKTEEWLKLLKATRAALYSDKITLQEYQMIMDELASI